MGSIQQLFVRANQELKKVIDQIGDEQWGLQMPAGLTSKPIDLKGAVNYHAYDDAWVPEVLEGKIKEEVGDKYESVLASDDTKNVYAKYNGLAIKAVEPFAELDLQTHLSYGDYPAREYLQHITLFRGLRSYDIAKLIGVDATLAPDFVQGLWDEYETLADGYREYGILPPALEAPDNADLQTKLLALVGRE